MSQKSLEETNLLWIQVDLLPGLQLLLEDEVQQLQARKTFPEIQKEIMIARISKLDTQLPTARSVLIRIKIYILSTS